MKIRGGYLPSGYRASENIAYTSMRYESNGEQREIEVPSLTPGQLASLADYLSERRRLAVASLSVMDIVDAVDAAVQRLLLREGTPRAEAERWLHTITGYDTETVRLGLHKTLTTFRKPQLLRFLAQDFHNMGILDHFVAQPAGGFAKAYGPQLSTHIWAGNVPGLPAWSLIASLLVKSPLIGKLSSSEPYFAGWLAEAIAEQRAELADSMAVVWWKGGDADSERAVYSASEAVIAYGGTETIRHIRQRVPPEVRCLTFGHKISFGFIAKEALQVRQASHLSAQAALDVARYDQQGCYSPQQFFVETGGRIEPRAFAKALAHDLDNLQRVRPMRRLTVQELSAKAMYIAEHGAASTETWTGADGGWTVLYNEAIQPQLTPSCLYRTVRVTAVPSLETAVEALSPFRKFLQTAGVAASPERLFAISERLGEAGVTRICGLGDMVSPEPGWHHDGRFHLLDLVRIVDIERSGEDAAERYADYRE
jgi:hypothetical protein